MLSTKKMRPKYFFIILLLLTLTGLMLYRNSTKPSNSADEAKFTMLPHELSFSGQLGSFDIQPGIESFKRNAQYLDSLSLFWYKLNADGSVSRDSEVITEIEDDLIAYAKENGIEVLFGIENEENNEIVGNLLRNKDVRKRHIEEILLTLSEKGYDGVIVDYENLLQDQANGFVSYVEEVATAIRAQRKIIGISVMTELSGRVFHGIDLVKVSQIVDSLELAAYEEFGEYSSPGPVA